MAQRWAQIWYATTALVGLLGLAGEIVLSASYPNTVFTTAAGRMTNELFYFTILSNVLVAGTSALLAIRPGRTSPAFRVFRLSALVGIVITAVVYHAVLAGLAHLTGLWVVTNQLLHTVAPLLAVAGWLLFDPRGLGAWRDVLLSLLYPAAYLAVTLVRGPLVGWYPYPFLDVAHIGYATMVRNAVVVALLYLGVAALVRGVDRRLARRRPAPRVDEPAAEAAAVTPCSTDPA